MGTLTPYAWLSFAAALATALKGVAAWITGSVGLLSDALESFVNLGAALLALWMLRVAAVPPGWLILDPHRAAGNRGAHPPRADRGRGVLQGPGAVPLAGQRLRAPAARTGCARSHPASA